MTNSCEIIIGTRTLNGGRLLINYNDEDIIIDVNDMNKFLHKNKISVSNASNKMGYMQYARSNNAFILNKYIINECDCKLAFSVKTDKDADKIIAKAKLLGYKVTDKDTGSIIYTTDEVMIVSKNRFYVEDGIGLFARTKFSEIDLSGINMSMCNSCEFMFERCNTKIINIGELNLENCINMRAMFYKCTVEKIDFSNVKTCKDGVSTISMFEDSNISEIIFNKDFTITSSSMMFYNGEFGSIYMKGVTIKLKNSDKLMLERVAFDRCHIGRIELSNAKVEKQFIEDITGCNANIERINISVDDTKYWLKCIGDKRRNNIFVRK